MPLFVDVLIVHVESYSQPLGYHAKSMSPWQGRGHQPKVITQPCCRPVGGSSAGGTP